MPAPSEMTPESRRQIKRPARSSLARSFACELNPAAMKLAMIIGVIGASAPPAIARSASPERIIAAASAIASIPDGHAEETVTAFAQAPSRSAMTLAAACGIEAPRQLWAARLGLGPLTASNTLSITSSALVLTPMTTGVGLGSSRLLMSRPGVLQRHHRGGVGKLRVACHALRLQLRLDEIEGIEIFYFAGDPALEIGRIKEGDRPDAAAGRPGAIPRKLEPDAIRGQDAHSGNNNSISLIHGTKGKKASWIRQRKAIAF